MLQPIKNTTELYSRMDSIRDWQDVLKQDCCQIDEYLMHKLNHKIAEAKRAVRDYYRKHRYSFDDDPRIIRDGSDECIVLTPLPKDINNAETADEWFKAFEYIPIRYSAYDCTGQIFTGWYKIIYRNGRFYAYHSLKCDC